MENKNLQEVAMTLSPDTDNPTTGDTGGTGGTERPTTGGGGTGNGNDDPTKS